MLPSYFCFSMPFILFAFHSDTETLLWIDVVSMFLLRLLKLAIWYLNWGIIQPREHFFLLCIVIDSSPTTVSGKIICNHEEKKFHELFSNQTTKKSSVCLKFPSQFFHIKSFFFFLERATPDSNDFLPSALSSKEQTQKKSCGQRNSRKKSFVLITIHKLG